MVVVVVVCVCISSTVYIFTHGHGHTFMERGGGKRVHSPAKALMVFIKLRYATETKEPTKRISIRHVAQCPIEGFECASVSVLLPTRLRSAFYPLLLL